MRALVLLLIAPLGGCYGGRVNAPSLQPRAEESRPIALPDDVAEAAAPLDPTLGPRLAAIVAQAEAGHRLFVVERTAAAAALARSKGQKEGSEAWVAAQEARSALAAARGPVGDAAAAVDALRVDPAHAAAADRAAIDAAAARIDTLAADERGAEPG